MHVSRRWISFAQNSSAFNVLFSSSNHSNSRVAHLCAFYVKVDGSLNPSSLSITTKASLKWFCSVVVVVSDSPAAAKVFMQLNICS